MWELIYEHRKTVYISLTLHNLQSVKYYVITRMDAQGQR